MKLRHTCKGILVFTHFYINVIFHEFLYFRNSCTKKATIVLCVLGFLDVGQRNCSVDAIRTISNLYKKFRIVEYPRIFVMVHDTEKK